jgi:hypothetical protein
VLAQRADGERVGAVFVEAHPVIADRARRSAAAVALSRGGPQRQGPGSLHGRLRSARPETIPFSPRTVVIELIGDRPPRDVAIVGSTIRGGAISAVVQGQAVRQEIGGGRARRCL